MMVNIYNQSLIVALWGAYRLDVIYVTFMGNIYGNATLCKLVSYQKYLKLVG